MSDLISQDVLKSLAAERGVSEAELDALCLALTGKSIDEIAQTFGITSIAVRKRLGEVYRKFDIKGKGPGKLEALKRVLEMKSQRISEPDNIRKDWGNAPDVSVFYGREKELQELQKWIVDDGCRLVALLGMTGIGKTAVVAKLAKIVQNQFNYVIWRSLLYPPYVEEILRDIIGFLSGNKEVDLPDNLNDKVTLLMDCLRKQKCLLVLDNVEMILRSDTRIGRYIPEYKNYGLLLRRIGEEEHQSCLLLCSQGKPKEIAVLESPNGYVRFLQLQGLELEDAQKILEGKGLTGVKNCKNLIKFTRTYWGNPLALKRICMIVKNLFNGDLDEFIQYSYNTLILNETFIEMFDDIFKKISNEEKEIMRYLAKQEKPISMVTLQKELKEDVSKNELIQLLESLEWRLLIEKQKNQNSSVTLFSLDSTIKKYTAKYQTA